MSLKQARHYWYSKKEFALMCGDTWRKANKDSTGLGKERALHFPELVVSGSFQFETAVISCA
jgi:hypothetical protein